MFQVNAICKFLVGAAMVCVMGLPCLAEDSVLLWMVDDTTELDNGGSGSLYSFVVSYMADDDYNWPAVRVKFIDSSGTVQYPDLYWGDSNPNNPGIREPGDFGVYVGDNGSGYWGCGVPVGNQSILDGLAGEVLFQMELGQIYSLDDTYENLVWTAVAWSEYYTLDELDTLKHIYQSFDINPLTATPWNPKLFTTAPSFPSPEPSTSILILLGVATLALKRRRAC